MLLATGGCIARERVAFTVIGKYAALRIVTIFSRYGYSLGLRNCAFSRRLFQPHDLSRVIYSRSENGGQCACSSFVTRRSHFRRNPPDSQLISARLPTRDSLSTRKTVKEKEYPGSCLKNSYFRINIINLPSKDGLEL
ncbi:hypothetical protein PUN28_006619 [Cardiocondyla obscurior]|uniref:Uncharacterized protein n=1 Tax=Cardiocondyla obscurior TaxID=286306 RepID=A0AAW2GA35_9HYME